MIVSIKFQLSNTFRSQCVWISDYLLYSYIQEWMLDVSIEQNTVLVHNSSSVFQFSSLYIPYLVSIQQNTSGLELEMKEPLQWLMRE